jgi:hypothetical protein
MASLALTKYTHVGKFGCATGYQIRGMACDREVVRQDKALGSVNHQYPRDLCLYKGPAPLRNSHPGLLHDGFFSVKDRP